jgi:hypothetical protein
MVGHLAAQLGRGRLPGLDPECALVEPVEHVLPREADPAEHLDRALAGEHRRVGRVGLRRRCRHGRIRLVVRDAPRRPPGERTGELRVRERARKRVGHRLVRPDPTPELLALCRVGDGELERAGCDPHRLEREDRQRAGAQRGQKLRREEGTSRLAARHDPERPRLVARGEHLAAGALELPHRVTTDDGDVRSGVEIRDERRQRERPAPLARRDGRLVLGLQEREQRGGRPQGRVQQRRTRRFVEHRLLEEAETRAAVLLRDRRAGPAELGQLRPRRLGRVGEEPPRLVAELLLQRREREVHAAYLDLGRPSTRSARMLRRISDVPASIVLPRLRSCCVVQ